MAYRKQHEDQSMFYKRVSIEQVEEGKDLAPKFDSLGHITCVTTHADTGEVLMVGVMNEEAFIRTIESGEAHYWSRSRQTLWHKGGVSGYVQDIVEIRIDDDQDAVWLRVRLRGKQASCHVGYRSCFYRKIDPGDGQTPPTLSFTETEKVFDPSEVYGDASNPTIL
ncbi:phosphoribosyl-AMP cyclohydrolase [Psychrobacter sp. LV10R520-6]|uniref:phosphoribosyl-AMP cyclohydrolase n=1 Tax=Psychrobacter sp. LV10R520-6 TaxID=1415574 RepID=UPI0024CB616E|nr:phosphoribosyl-AMP cyclohydrolase [Psychrobacter sp. LV10R520-6]SNT69849.1 phosphoribosyl-AMP cyclohydrolase [Psychrobacter sp. LV10R520-6]